MSVDAAAVARFVAAYLETPSPGAVDWARGRLRLAGRPSYLAVPSSGDGIYDVDLGGALDALWLWWSDLGAPPELKSFVEALADLCLDSEDSGHPGELEGPGDFIYAMF